MTLHGLIPPRGQANVRLSSLIVVPLNAADPKTRAWACSTSVAALRRRRSPKPDASVITHAAPGDSIMEEQTELKHVFPVWNRQSYRTQAILPHR